MKFYCEDSEKVLQEIGGTKDGLSSAEAAKRLEENGKLVLNGILNQRSQDVLAANNWNVVQYCVLLHMFAQVSGLEVGELVHVIADAHIYDRHVPIIKELIEREPYDAPKFEMDKSITDFYSFTRDSFALTDYKFHGFDTKIPVAI